MSPLSPPLVEERLRPGHGTGSTVGGDAHVWRISGAGVEVQAVVADGMQQCPAVAADFEQLGIGGLHGDAVGVTTNIGDGHPTGGVEIPLRYGVENAGGGPVGGTHHDPA
ncbi:MAG TPA: hypothetical protein VHV83_17770, partial [Armatimonadota bacterium]|nr:hypothetical protein [Armatimonadota bacterium]